MFASLQLLHVPGDFSHAVCGPWGCGPPLQALVACHSFWGVALLLPAGVFHANASADRMRWVGRMLTLVSLAGLVGVAAWQVIDWWPAVSDWQRSYLPQRILFVLATTVEVPLLQGLLFGGALWMAGTVRGRASSDVNAAKQAAPSVSYPSAHDTV